MLRHCHGHYVFSDFPNLRGSTSAVAQVLGVSRGDWNLLRADVLKVSHHGSKHGVSLELIERIKPATTLISSTSGASRYGFDAARTPCPSTTSGCTVRGARSRVGFPMGSTPMHTLDARGAIGGSAPRMSAGVRVQ
jgi:hypothetical protein